MLLKNYIYLNILFLFGLFLYFISINFSLNLFNIFYLFFSLFGTIIPLLLYFSEFVFKDIEEERSYKVLFVGFFVYGLGNIIWYFKELLSLNFDLDFINILFFFQIFTKYYFFKYLNSVKGESKNKVFDNLFSVNLLILLFAILLGESFNLSSQITDIYFIFESLLSIIFIFYYLANTFTGHLDLNYFGLGNLAWLIADVLFLVEVNTNHYFMGNLSDFIYFVGFYFMLASLIFKNFSFINLTGYFNKNLNFT